MKDHSVDRNILFFFSGGVNIFNIIQCALLLESFQSLAQNKIPFLLFYTVSLFSARKLLTITPKGHRASANLKQSLYDCRLTESNFTIMCKCDIITNYGKVYSMRKIFPAPL